MIGNKINDKTYIPLPPFKGWVLENFPFIEADFDAITNYQLLCKIIEYLNNVISNQNTVQQLGTELVNYYNALVDAVNLAINEFETEVTADINQFKIDVNADITQFKTDVNSEVNTFKTFITGKFNELQTFVNNYFDNLDVQNEINNKLDDLVEDGTMEELAGVYLNPYLQQMTTTINNTLNSQNATIQNINKKVDSSVNMNPLVANSMADMTNTSKIYVLTSNGKWYYYDGTNWVVGGDYQSNVDSSDLTYLEELFEPYKYNLYPVMNLLDVNAIETDTYWWNANGVAEKRTSTNVITFNIFPVKAGVKYALYENGSTLSGNIATGFSYICDKNGTIIGNITLDGIHKFTPSVDGFCYLTCNISTTDTLARYESSVLCVDGKNNGTLSTFNEVYDFYILNTSYKEMYDNYEILKDIPSELNYLNEIFNPYKENLLPIMNLLDATAIETDSYWWNVNGVTEKRTASNLIITNIFPVKAGVKYALYDNGTTLSGNVAVGFSYICDKDGNVTGNITLDGIHKFTPSVDGYCHLTCNVTTTDTLAKYQTAVICVEGKNPTSFKDYNVVYDFDILNTSYIEMYDYYEELKHSGPAITVDITVGSDKDFTTISSALNSIQDATSTKKYNVLIDDGTYNETSLVVPDYVNLIGVSGNPDNCIIDGSLPASSSDALITQTATINLDFNSDVKNITIKGKNIRYPVHSETGGEFKNWTQNIINCKIIHLGNDEVIQYRIDHDLDPGSPWSACHAWGMGASSGCHLIIDNCLLQATLHPFSTHAANNFEKPYLIEIKNSKLISTTLLNSIYIDNSASNVNGNTLIVTNTFLNSRYAVITSANYDFNCQMSGCPLVPYYQPPNRTNIRKGFPYMTEYCKEMIAGENLSKTTFVTSSDGIHVTKATGSTPLKDILGFVIGDTNQGEMALIFRGYLEPTSQSWPEESITTGIKYKLDNNGKITPSNSNDDIIVAISEDRWYKLYV